MTDQQKYEATLLAAQKRFPGFQIKHKDEVWHQRLLGSLMFFTNFRSKEFRKNGEPWYDPTWGYMHYTTTFGKTVYFPSGKWVERRQPWRTLQHELVHTWDFMTFYGKLPEWLWPINFVLFALCYLLPAPFPLPSPGRTWAELRAYRRSIEMHPEDKAEKRARRYAAFFTGPDYLFMWWWGPWVEKRLLSAPSPYKAEMDAWLDGAG